jgi:hypothetical protein
MAESSLVSFFFLISSPIFRKFRQTRVKSDDVG